MKSLTSLCKKREDLELEEALNPYTKNSSFKFELNSLSISALLFIEEYFRPDLKDDSYFYLKISRQFTFASKILEFFLKNDEKINSKHNWWDNNLLSNIEREFSINYIPNPDFFNYVINNFPNKGLSGPVILDIAISSHIQLFYNFINNVDNKYPFPTIRETKKKAMKYDNGRLVEILSEIENTGCGLEFLPSVDRYEIALVD